MEQSDDCYSIFKRKRNTRRKNRRALVAEQHSGFVLFYCDGIRVLRIDSVQSRNIRAENINAVRGELILETASRKPAPRDHQGSARNISYRADRPSPHHPQSLKQLAVRPCSAVRSSAVRGIDNSSTQPGGRSGHDVCRNGRMCVIARCNGESRNSCTDYEYRPQRSAGHFAPPVMY